MSELVQQMKTLPQGTCTFKAILSYIKTKVVNGCVAVLNLIYI